MGESHEINFRTLQIKHFRPIYERHTTTTLEVITSTLSFSRYEPECPDEKSRGYLVELLVMLGTGTGIHE